MASSAAAGPSYVGADRLRAGVMTAPKSVRADAVPASGPGALNPADNIVADPVEPFDCTGAAAPTCATDAVHALNHARTVLHQRGYQLPANFFLLPTNLQLLVLSNDDRSLYGLNPVIGLSPPLNAAAAQGVAADDDPPFVYALGGGNLLAGGSNWAAGFSSALYAYYFWMYADGVRSAGGGNIDCTHATDAGCWGHRDDTLVSTPAGSQLVMGVGIGRSPRYVNGYTELYEAVDGAANVPYLPYVTGISAASGPSSGGSSVTVAGYGLAGITRIRFGVSVVNFSAATGLTVTAVSPPGLGTLDVTVTTLAGTSPADPWDRFSFVGTGPATEYHPIAPVRLLDTRSTAAIPARGVLAVQVNGQLGLPATGVTAVAINVTAIAGTSPGFVTAYPGHTIRPPASNLNFTARQTIANMVFATTGADGTIDFYNSSGRPIELVGDIAGYFVTATLPTDPGAFEALAPTRLLDTRSGIGAAAVAVPARHAITLQVTGRGGVPAGVAAVVLNETVTNPTSTGYVSSYAANVARPNVSSLNFSPGQTVPNLVVVPVSPTGQINLYNGSGGTVNLVADVAGVFLAGTPAASGQFGSLPITRILDTRGLHHPVGPHQTLILTVAGVGGLPTAPGAVALNVTTTNVNGSGFLTVYGGGLRPNASNINLARGKTVPNLVLTPVTLDGTVRIYNGSSAPISVTADVEGYFSP